MMTRAEFIQRFVLSYKQVASAITFADSLEKNEVPFDEPEELEPADDDDDLDALFVALDEMIAGAMHPISDGHIRTTVDRETFRAVVRALATARAALQGATDE